MKDVIGDEVLYYRFKYECQGMDSFLKIPTINLVNEKIKVINLNITSFSPTALTPGT